MHLSVFPVSLCARANQPLSSCLPVACGYHVYTTARTPFGLHVHGGRWSVVGPQHVAQHLDTTAVLDHHQCVCPRAVFLVRYTSSLDLPSPVRAQVAWRCVLCAVCCVLCAVCCAGAFGSVPSMARVPCYWCPRTWWRCCNCVRAEVSVHVRVYVRACMCACATGLWCCVCCVRVCVWCVSWCTGPVLLYVCICVGLNLAAFHGFME